MDYTETLCNSCSKAIPPLCPWIDKGDLAGIEYDVKKTRYYNSNGSFGDYENMVITKCPRYKKGALPPLSKLG